MGMSLSKLRELVMDKEAWRAVIHSIPKSWTRLSDWTELNGTKENYNQLYIQKSDSLDEIPWKVEATELTPGKHI